MWSCGRGVKCYGRVVKTGALVLDDFIPYRLSVASNEVSEAVSRVYRAMFGLSIPEWRVVAVVGETESLTQQAIGQRTAMDKVTVSRAAIRLEARDLIARRPDPQDGRAHQLNLTDAGRTLYHQVAPRALDLERRLFESFSEDERRVLATMLRRIEIAARALQQTATHAGDASAAS